MQHHDKNEEEGEDKNEEEKKEKSRLKGLLTHRKGNPPEGDKLKKPLH